MTVLIVVVFAVIGGLIATFFTSGMFMEIVHHGWRNDR